MANGKNIEFVKTTSDKLNDVLEMEDGRYQESFIHTHDVGGNGTTDDQLYIGEDRITDKFNLGDTVLSTQTLKVGGLESTTFNALKNKSISEILIEILSPISVSSVTLNMNSLTMRVGGSTLALIATVLPSNASDTTVTWSSSDTSIATVDGGVVTAVGLGDVIITASAGNKSATCNITVEATPVSSVTLSQSSLTFNTPNAYQTLTATVNPSTATDKTVTWSSSNENVVIVNSSGKVSVVGVGTATVTATASGKTANCSITVSPKVPSKKTNPSASISYNGSRFMGAGDILPTTNDVTVTYNRGSWNNYDGYYAGTVTSIEKIMSPNQWGQPAVEGTYTIHGEVTFNAGPIPVDNFNYGDYSDLQYGGGTVNTSTITINVVNPIYINGYLTDDGDDHEDITHMRRYVVDYRENVTLYITIPSETYSSKMCIYLKGTFTTFKVLQFDKFAEGEDKYIIPIDMVASPETTPTYEGYTKYVRGGNTYTNVAPAQYKITFRK